MALAVAQSELIAPSLPFQVYATAITNCNLHRRTPHREFCRPASAPGSAALTIARYNVRRKHLASPVVGAAPAVSPPCPAPWVRDHVEAPAKLAGHSRIIRGRRALEPCDRNIAAMRQILSIPGSLFTVCSLLFAIRPHGENRRTQGNPTASADWDRRQAGRPQRIVPGTAWAEA
jgi:hypothetical protein